MIHIYIIKGVGKSLHRSSQCATCMPKDRQISLLIKVYIYIWFSEMKGLIDPKILMLINVLK